MSPVIKEEAQYENKMTQNFEIHRNNFEIYSTQNKQDGTILGS